MTEPLITLDKSKPYSENLGETTPDDPLHRVRFWQGGKFQGHMVLLPFDAHGALVEDDGKDGPFTGLGPEGKPLQFHPLYNPRMRAYLEAKRQRAATVQAPLEDESEAEAGGAQVDAADEVNFELWLKGEARYKPHVLRAAAKKRFSKNYQDLKELVIDLVDDENLVPREALCAAFAKYFEPVAA